jgi:hypothetical protein
VAHLLSFGTPGAVVDLSSAVPPATVAMSLTAARADRWEGHDGQEELMVDATISAGSGVDVWCASTSRWVSGFRVAALRPDGLVEVLGRDGGPPLPVAFDRSELRPTEHAPRSPWAGVDATVPRRPVTVLEELVPSGSGPS